MTQQLMTLSSYEYVPRHHVLRVYEELKNAGAVAYNMWLPETHYLPRVVRGNEHIHGSVYGKYNKTRGAFVATDQRVIVLNKKPMFVGQGDISYEAVESISRTQVGPIGTVTINTRAEDYMIRTFNQKNAKNFVEYVAGQYLQGEKSHTAHTKGGCP